MKNIIQTLTQIATNSPYILVILYYVIKQVIKIFISSLMDKRMNIQYHMFDIGPDLCFMGFTLFAAALSANSPKFNSFLNPSLAIFFYTIFLIGLYSFSYALIQEFKRLGKSRNSSGLVLFNRTFNGRGIVALRTVYLLVSIFLGATAFGIVIELVR